MTVVSRAVTSNVLSASAEIKDPRIATTGVLTLVAGSATETIPSIPSLSFVMVERITAGGALGHLTAAFNATTGVLTVTSSSGTDTSVIAYALIAQ